MSRKPKVDQDELVVASGFGRGGKCKASDQKKHEKDMGRKPPKPKPEDDN